jgi:hypothetical protein
MIMSKRTEPYARSLFIQQFKSLAESDPDRHAQAVADLVVKKMPDDVRHILEPNAMDRGLVSLANALYRSVLPAFDGIKDSGNDPLLPLYDKFSNLTNTLRLVNRESLTVGQLMIGDLAQANQVHTIDEFADEFEAVVVYRMDNQQVWSVNDRVTRSANE